MWGLAMLAWSACSNEDQFLNENNGEQTVTFRPVIKQDMHSRTIGDATGIDRLKVAVSVSPSSYASSKWNGCGQAARVAGVSSSSNTTRLAERSFTFHSA